jgi:hypothetical protein
MLEAILLPTATETRLWFAGSRLMLSDQPCISESGHHLYFTKHQEDVSASDWVIVDGKSVYQVGALNNLSNLKGRRIENVVATTDEYLIDRGVAEISGSELHKWVTGKNSIPIPDIKVEPNLELPSFFAVMVEGKQSPVKTHKTYDEALEEAVRLCEKEHRSTFVLSAVSMVSPSKPTVHYLGGNP